MESDGLNIVTVSEVYIIGQQSGDIVCNNNCDDWTVSTHSHILA